MKKINSNPNNQLRSIDDDDNPLNGGNSNAQYSKDDDLKNILKRPPMFISRKMPDAFLNRGNNKKPNQLSSIGDKFQRLGKYDQQKNIDNMIEQQEYKQVQNLLQPINVNEDRLSPQHSNQTRQQELKNKMKDVLNPSSNLKNPILSYRSVMQCFIAHEQAIKETIDLSKEKLQIIGAQRQRKIIQSSIKLEEMITLGVIKCSKDSGTVKKIFHTPTLRLYTVKEVPLVSKQIRQNLRDWAGFWQTKLHDTGKHTKLYGAFWNVPEACVSMLTEFLSGGSLQELLESFGTLPESIIKSVIAQVIESLDIIHKIQNNFFGGLTPSQILFKQDGTAKVKLKKQKTILNLLNKQQKLSLGLSYRSQQEKDFFSSINFSKQNDRMSLFDPNGINTPNLFKSPLDKNTNNQRVQILRQDDVFKLGMLALSCAIGSFDIIENTSLFFECIHKIIDEQNRPDISYKVCCLLHAEDVINSMMDEKLKINTQKQKIKLSINSLLSSNRFSSSFLDFLCQTLRFNYQTRATLQSLKQHPFITNEQKTNGANIKITDLLKHSQGWTRKESLPTNYQGASEQALERLCEGILLVLPMCEKWYKNQAYHEYTRHIKHINPESPYIQILAQDLGLDANLVYSKIMQVYESFPFINTKRNVPAKVLESEKIIEGYEQPPFFQDNNNSNQVLGQQQQYSNQN